MAGMEKSKKKKIGIIVVSSFILVAMVVAVTLGTTLTKKKAGGDKKPAGSELSDSEKVIKSLCQPTDYRQVCEDTLKKGGANTTDPKELVKVAFDVGSQHMLEAAKKSDVLRELAKDPRTSAALENCREMMEFAVNDLKKSMSKIGDLDIMNVGEVVEDLKIWTSAAITYQETCLDGFENTTGDAAAKMREALKVSSELTSVGLAMITEISSAISSLTIPDKNNRRLLNVHVLGHESETSFVDPTWIDSGRRRLLTGKQVKPQATVAKDGSGNYKTIHEALKQVPKKNQNTYVIYIKEGVYNEHVVVENSMTNVMFIGDGPTKTRISGSLNFVDGIPTSKTATVIVHGDYFMAKDIGFENTAGAEKHQAVALRVQSDFSVFYNCHMDGYQDTLYVHTSRQFYRNCTISGTIDFIFGDAAAVLQNCRMIVRKPLDNQFCAVTAQGRKDRRQPTAIVIQGGKIIAASDYSLDTKTYLGRPWKAYSRTVVMEAFIDSLIAPEGWQPWAGDINTETCFYAEFNNKGPGSSTSQRVKWRGVKRIASQNAMKYTPRLLLGGDRWIPQKEVPYTGGMLSSKA